jgi:hypothetical protein
MFDINFPIFGKGAVVREDSEELPDVWKFLSGNFDDCYFPLRIF